MTTLFPVGKVLHKLRKKRNQIWTLDSAIYLAAAAEYLTAEVLELAGYAARDRMRACITEEDIATCVAHDADIRQISCPTITNLKKNFADMFKIATETTGTEEDSPTVFQRFKEMSQESFESFVANGGNLKIRDSTGQTYLHYIVSSDEEIDYEVFPFLVSQHLDEIVDNKGNIPLIYAVRHKDTETADYLTCELAKYGHVKITQNILLEAIKHEKCSEETLELLISKADKLDSLVLSAIVSSDYEFQYLFPCILKYHPHLYPYKHCLYDAVLCEKEDFIKQIYLALSSKKENLNEIDIVETLFFSGVDNSENLEILLTIDRNLVNLTTSDGRTLVHEYLSNGDSIDVFVRINSCLLTQTDVEDRPPLFDAIQGLDNKSFVDFLERHKNSLNFRARSIDGSNFMHEFLYHRSFDSDYISSIFNIVNEKMGTLAALLQEQDNDGRTPLMINPYIAAVEQFPKDPLKLTVNVQDRFGRTALMYARNVEEMQLLLELGADPNIQDENGDTALHMVICHNKDMTQLLEKNNADVDITNKRGFTPKTIFQILNGELEGAKLVKDKEMEEDDLNLFEESLYNPMSKEVIELLKKGANTTNEYGRTALHDLVLTGDLKGEELQLFLKYSADPNIQDNDGRNVIMEAIHTAERLTPELTLLIDLVKDVNTKDNSGSSLLHEAFECVDVNVFDYLISKGVNINATDNQGKTVLHRIVEYETSSEDVVKYLIEKGINVNIQDVYGSTVLHQVIEKPSNIRDIILEATPDFSLLNLQGKSPLHIYLQNGCPDEADLETMVQNGANIFTSDCEGKTVLELCKGLPLEIINNLILQSTPVCASIFKGESTIYMKLEGKTIPIHVEFIKYRAPLFFAQISIKGNVATLKSKFDHSAVAALLEYIYTDTTSQFSDSLKQLAEEFQIPRLVAMCDVSAEISSTDLQTQFPSTLINDAKAVYLKCNSSTQIITIICTEQTRFNVNKLILLSTDYFRKMLQSGMQESQSSTINLPEVSVKSMQYVVEYLLSGILICDDGNELLELYIAANHLCIHSLSTLCQILLAKQIEESNVQTLLEFSEMYGASMLRNSCKEFSKQNKTKMTVLEKAELSVVWPYCDFLDIVEEEKKQNYPQIEFTTGALAEMHKAAEELLIDLFAKAKQVTKAQKRKYVSLQDVKQAKVKWIDENEERCTNTDE